MMVLSGIVLSSRKRALPAAGARDVASVPRFHSVSIGEHAFPAARARDVASAPRFHSVSIEGARLRRPGPGTSPPYRVSIAFSQETRVSGGRGPGGRFPYRFNRKRAFPAARARDVASVLRFHIIAFL